MSPGQMQSHVDGVVLSRYAELRRWQIYIRNTSFSFAVSDQPEQTIEGVSTESKQNETGCVNPALWHPSHTCYSHLLEKNGEDHYGQKLGPFSPSSQQ